MMAHDIWNSPQPRSPEWQRETAILADRLRALRLTPEQLERRKAEAERRVGPFVGNSYVYPAWVKR